jgi:molybdopterin converting factor small subunit
MPVTFHIPGYLRDFTGGRSDIHLNVSPANLRDALEAVCSVHPGVRDRVMNEQGQVREHINVFLGDENMRFLQGLTTPLPDDSEITIVPAVSGG